MDILMSNFITRNSKRRSIAYKRLMAKQIDLVCAINYADDQPATFAEQQPGVTIGTKSLRGDT